MLPDQVRATAPIVKSLNEIVQRKRENKLDCTVDFSQLKRASDPQSVFARYF